MSSEHLDAAMAGRATELPVTPFAARFVGRLVGDSNRCERAVEVTAVLERTAVVRTKGELRLARRAELHVDPDEVAWRQITDSDELTTTARRRAWVSRRLPGARKRPAA